MDTRNDQKHMSGINSTQSNDGDLTYYFEELRNKEID